MKEAREDELHAIEMKESGGLADSTAPCAAEPTKVIYHGWKAMPYVIGNETFEKLGTIGTATNLLVYLTTVFHMNSVSSATLLNVFNGTTNLTPVIGAFLSDTYYGRYATLGFASIASFVGMMILTLTAGISKLHPPQHCGRDIPCKGPTPFQLATLFSAFAFLVVGAGGIRPCNLAFGADQFDPRTESGRRGINSFFNWYYFTYTFAVMVSSTIVIYIQSNINWALGLGIPTLLMFFSCASFFVGSPIYVKVKPEGSPYASIAQVFVAAFRKRGLNQSDDPENSLFNPPCHNALNSKLHYSDQFRFFDKAAIVTEVDSIKPNGLANDPWRLCTLQQVEEVKCLIRIIPIWSAGIIFSIPLAQQSTYVVFQALQFDRHLGHGGFEIPAASYTVFTMVAITIWIPFYDRILVPRLRRVTGKEEGITLLQRMGIGIIISIVAMVVAAVIEIRRKNDALHRPTIGLTSTGSAISPMSSLWLIPQLVLIGLSEAFNLIGQIEFYYKQFPENMRSIAGSLFFLGVAISNYLSSLMVTIVHQTTGGNGKGNWLDGDLNKGKLEHFYFLIAIIGALNFVYFIICSKWYKYKRIDGGQEIALEGSKSKAPPV